MTYRQAVTELAAREISDARDWLVAVQSGPDTIRTKRAVFKARLGVRAAELRAIRLLNHLKDNQKLPEILAGKVRQMVSR